MDSQIDLFTLLSLIVALVAILKLRSVLGRKTGDEETRAERRSKEIETRRASMPASASAEKVVSLPRRPREEPERETVPVVTTAEAEARIRSIAGVNTSVSDGLMRILKLDQAFDPEHFLRGAKQAYEMIVTAYAESNRKTLRELLTKDVYDGFVSAIAEREQRGEQIDQSFVGINKADILEADVKNGTATITVRFLSQLITATRDKAGAVISGDASKVIDITDIWTFSRDISTAKARQNLYWLLLETQDVH